eukprot:scaffold14305_cov47-Cyclotella_meneghiniana.AAC.2
MRCKPNVNIFDYRRPEGHEEGVFTLLTTHWESRMQAHLTRRSEGLGLCVVRKADHRSSMPWTRQLKGIV